MQHPFALKISDLESQVSGKDLVEELKSNEAESVSGGLSIHTIEGKEEGGFCYPCPEPIICPVEFPIHIDITDIEVTTYAIGEEGGGYPCIEVKPIKSIPKPIEPPYATTQAIGEEGGDCFPIF